jgi:1,4-alpha-glucan branching enzyme
MHGDAPVTSATLTDYDVYLWAEGSHFRAYDKLGAHLVERNGVAGTRFAVWAPDAESVSVVGDFNGWREGAHRLRPVASSGIWECFVPHVGPGTLYKFAITSRYYGQRTEKADPYAFAAEIRPLSASKVWDLSRYQWRDDEWMRRRAQANALDAPMSIYEVHLGSWRRNPYEGNRWHSYRELAMQLVDYVADMGFTHVEFLPVSEHPLDASWGYQTVGYYAPTSRFGTPDDFMVLVDALHRRGIGVILDWVPAHFPRDGHGLGWFDGTHLYEHADPRLGEHRDWGTYVFNFGRKEVANFLISNALFWLDRYHIDGLRVDAVASMLYLDYSRSDGDWVPNQYGGRENIDAIHFLRRLNERVYGEFPGAFTVAEESTAWPMVSRPTFLGGLGFGYKWDMGWMHDTLGYLEHDPVHRRYHHDRLTFRQVYAFSENYVLALSHDEVVHGKRSLLAKMPGDDWQRFANLRLLFGYQYTQPGKKLLFMGAEVGQWTEWNYDGSIDWYLLQYAPHQGVQRWVRDLNALYRTEPAFHQRDCEQAGFEWVDCCDADSSVLSYLRRGREPTSYALVVLNFTPVVRQYYRVGVPLPGEWEEALNSDALCYGGSGQGNLGAVSTEPWPCHGRRHSVVLTLPPLGLVVFRPKPGSSAPGA